MTWDTSQPWLVGERWNPNSNAAESVLLGMYELCGLAQMDELVESDSLFQDFQARMPRLLLLHRWAWNKEVLQTGALRKSFETVSELLRKLPFEGEQESKCRDEQRWSILRSLRRTGDHGPSVSATSAVPSSLGLLRQVCFLSWVPEISVS